MGSGGTGGSVSSLTLSLQASASEVEPGDVTELSWTATNAVSCEASGGWTGRKSADDASQPVPVFRDTTYTLTCVDGAGDEVSKSVTVVVSGRLMATVEVSPNPAEGGERGLATIRVSNPSDTRVDDVRVDLQIPDFVDALSPDDYSAGGSCSGSCGAGDTITWQLDALEPAEVVTLLVFPTIALNVPAGTTLVFALTVSAPEEPMVQRTAATKEGERSLAVELEPSTSKVEPGEEVTYAVHYANQSGGTLQDVVVILVLPPGTELVIASSGGALMPDGSVQWTFVELAPGQGGTVSGTVTVDKEEPSAEL
jgi:uncharacterized repeat protein (TIGR01451 family)